MINPKNFKHVKSQVKKQKIQPDENDKFPVYILPNEFLVNLKCDYCFEKMDLVYDHIHGEIICNKCGYVLVDNFFM